MSFWKYQVLMTRVVRVSLGFIFVCKPVPIMRLKSKAVMSILVLSEITCSFLLLLLFFLNMNSALVKLKNYFPFSVLFLLPDKHYFR